MPLSPTPQSSLLDFTLFFCPLLAHMRTPVSHKLLFCAPHQTLLVGASPHSFACALLQFYLGRSPLTVPAAPDHM